LTGLFDSTPLNFLDEDLAMSDHFRLIVVLWSEKIEVPREQFSIKLKKREMREYNAQESLRKTNIPENDLVSGQKISIESPM
jgi:hypothetical protein